MAEHSSEITQLWEQAVDGYLSTSKRGSAAQRWKEPITTQADLDRLVDSHEAEFATFRRSRRKFWDVLMATMGQLQTLGAVAQAAVQLSPFAPAAVVLEAGIFVISSGAAVADTYDALETLFRRIRDITDRLDEYLQGQQDKKIHKLVIQLLSAFLDIFSEAEATIKRGRGKEMMRRVIGKENKIQTALDRLDELVQTEVALINAKTFATTQRIEHIVDNERDRGLLRRALCAEIAADNEAYGKTIENSRLSGSGDWILEEKLYKKWISKEFPVLWILGKPGTGKTYLASRILSHLHQDNDLGTASFFYIREGMNTQYTPEIILKVIAYQISQLNLAFRERAVKVCDEGQSLLLPETLWDSLFVKTISDDSTGPVIIVIDGVDEATPENQELIVKLAKQLSDLKFSAKHKPGIQLLLLGRPDLDYNVSNVWRGEKRRPKILYLQPSMSSKDVERFITKGVTERVTLLQKMRPVSAKRLKREIIKTLRDSSDGMFMLAKLMLAELKDMNKPELIREALSKPPRGLDDMFRRVIARLGAIGGFDKKDLNEIIMWVACAQRDLLLGELDLVLKLRDLRQNGIVALEDELRTRFGSFFTVMSFQDGSEDEDAAAEDAVSTTASDPTLLDNISDEDTELEDYSDIGSDDDDDATGGASEAPSDDEEEDDEVLSNYLSATVKFSHASVGQHFRNAPVHQGIGMDMSFAQAHITLTCLKFLTNNIPKRKGREWRHPTLFEYAVNHFLDHFVEVDIEQLRADHADIFQTLSQEVMFLLNDRTSIQRWFDALSNEYRFMRQLFSSPAIVRLRTFCQVPAINKTSTVEEAGPKNATDPKIFLAPFAKYVVEAWLKFETCGKMMAILFLQAYLSLEDDPNCLRWSLPPNRPFEHIAESISPAEIREMSSLGSLPKDTTFHLSLGRTLAKIRTQQHRLAAVDEFEHAVQVSDDSTSTWDVYCSKAEVLCAIGKFEESIAAASLALEHLPAYRSYMRRRILQIISSASLSLEKDDEAIQAAVRARDSAPNDPGVAFTLIFTAHRTANYSKTTALMQAALDSREGAQFLGHVINYASPQRYTTEYMSIACAKLGDLGLAKKAFEAVKIEATNVGIDRTIAAADLAIANLYFGFYRSDTRAIHLWEKVVEEHSHTVLAVTASFALMPVYYWKARSAEPKEKAALVSKMESLVDLIEPIRLNSSSFPTRYEARALLGRWYVENGQTELARANIRPFVMDSIGDLTDRDDDNDYEAFHNLARAFTCFGDKKNASIAIAFTKPLNSTHLGSQIDDDQDNTAAPTTAPKGSICVPSQFTGRCDGACTRREDTFKSFKLCEICVDVAFCEECYQKLLDDTATFRICNPEHPMCEVYPPKGLVTRGSHGYDIHVDDDKIISFNEWLALITKEWK